MTINQNICMTGRGLATALGLDVDTTWQAVARGQCGIAPMPALEQRPDPDKGGGQAVDLPRDFLPDDQRPIRYLKWVIQQALDEAGLSADNLSDAARISCTLGTTLHGMRCGGRFLRSDDPQDLDGVMAGRIAADCMEAFGAAGIAVTTCSACSSGLSAIALGMQMLRDNTADIVIAGGYDTVSEYVYAGFDSMRLVSSTSLMPFHKDREGMKVAEAYGIVILERLSDAQARGQQPVAHIGGFGGTSDMHHLTMPHPQGDGAARAIRKAIEEADASPMNVSMVAAHATATPNNDAAEFAAMQQVFGEQLPTVSVTAFKSHLGHTLGGAGVVELILSSKALQEGSVPPVANVAADDVEFDTLNLVTGNEPAKRKISHTLNMSLGFGGSNTAMVLADQPPTARDLPTDRQVHITGMGVLLPGVYGVDGLREYVAAGNLLSDLPYDIDAADLGELINARRTRRMSHYAKLSLAATTLAYRHAGIEDHEAFGRGCFGVLGSAHGAQKYLDDYYRQVVTEGIAAANPMLFAEGVPNVASAHLSVAFNIDGSCQTIIGTRHSGLDALGLAAMHIRTGHWERAVVSVAEEYNEQQQRVYRHFGQLRDDQFSASAAVTFILESDASANERKATSFGTVGKYTNCWPKRDVPTADWFDGVNASIVAGVDTPMKKAERLALRNACDVQEVLPGLTEMYAASPLCCIAEILASQNNVGTYAITSADCSGSVGVLRFESC